MLFDLCSCLEKSLSRFEIRRFVLVIEVFGSFCNS
jgi:hypothetical protein